MIRHILADGSEVESIEGLVIPPTGPTATAYRIVGQFAVRKQEEFKKKEAKANAEKRLGLA